MNKKNNLKAIKGNKKDKELNFEPFMELIDDDMILYHHSKSFKQPLSFDEAIEMLKEDGRIKRDKEADRKLREFFDMNNPS